MGPWQLGEHVWANLGRRRAAARAGDGGLSSLILGNGVGILWWGSGFDFFSYSGGEVRWSFFMVWLFSLTATAMGRQHGLELGQQRGKSSQGWCSWSLYIGLRVPNSRRGWSLSRTTLGFEWDSIQFWSGIGFLVHREWGKHPSAASLKIPGGRWVWLGDLGHGVGAGSKARHRVGADMKLVWRPTALNKRWLREHLMQGIHIPGVGPIMGQLGQLQWASLLEKKRKWKNGPAGLSVEKESWAEV
jgi:hypothetical protein